MLSIEKSVISCMSDFNDRVIGAFKDLNDRRADFAFK